MNALLIKWHSGSSKMATALFFTLLKFLYFCLTLYSNLLTLHKYLIQNPTLWFFFLLVLIALQIVGFESSIMKNIH